MEKAKKRKVGNINVVFNSNEEKHLRTKLDEIG